MGFFDNVSKDEFEKMKPAIWTKKERVQFKIIDFAENEEKKYLMIKTKILTGTNANKDNLIFIMDKDDEFSIRRKIGFLKAFWSEDDILNGRIKPEILVGRKFECLISPREYNGEVMYNYSYFKDLGLDTGSPEVPVANAPASTSEPKEDNLPF